MQPAGWSREGEPGLLLRCPGLAAGSGGGWPAGRGRQPLRCGLQSPPEQGRTV